MVRIQHKIHDGLELLQFFTTREWIFKSEQFVALYDEMSATDRKLLPVDFTAVPIDEYLRTSVLGTRQYCVKEDLSTLPRCRRVQKVYVSYTLFYYTFNVLLFLILKH